jgi:hypothetical protein
MIRRLLVRWLMPEIERQRAVVDQVAAQKMISRLVAISQRRAAERSAAQSQGSV